MVIKFLFAVVFSYFLGNIHFARLISKIRKDDITKHGSGNPGTMNMLRTHGFILAIFTLILDALKGAILALVGYYLLGGAGGGLTAVYAMYLCGFFAVIGHVFPLVYKFKGGKGVATAFGFFTVVNPLVSAILFAVGLILFFITKIGSISSIVYVCCFVTYQIGVKFNVNYILPYVILVVTAILIVFAHRTNVKKLIKKQENKINITEVVEKDKNLIKSTKQKLKKSDK